MDNSKLKIKNSKFALRAFTLVDPGFPDRSPGQALSGVTSLHKGFTLVELMIVVAILGILAAIVMPEFGAHIQQAKESAAKDNLRILREAIERYAADHNGVPPGNVSSTSQRALFFEQLKKASNINGDYNWPGTPGYPLGPYLPKIPDNPFTGYNDIYIIGEGVPFPTEALSPDLPPFAWIYQPSTKTIKLNQQGTDSNGILYIDY